MLRTGKGAGKKYKRRLWEESREKNAERGRIRKIRRSRKG
jgi:hypothetical protein